MLKALAQGILGLVLSMQGVLAENAPPGVYHTSWIGNSFGGSGALPKEGVGNRSNGFGYWVQDEISAMAVSPDGTVFLGASWDEAGRSVGLYRNGLPNRVLVKALSSPVKLPGFNTSNRAVCVDGGFFYVGNRAPALLKFSWNRGDINSAEYLREVPLAQAPIGLSCGNGKILIDYPARIELRDEDSLQPVASYPQTGLSAALLAPDGSYWVIAGGKVRYLRADGTDTGRVLPGIGSPTSLAWGNNGNLIVSDNGPAQQVLFFDVADQPKLTRRFGVAGGLYSGIPGEVAPQKLFALQGAGMDAKGNLYVGMSFGNDPNGNTFLRAFSPSGALLWQDHAAAFVDTFGFEPGSDGGIVFGRTTRWQLDLNRQQPGSEAVLAAVTLDPLRYPDDPRLKKGSSVSPRLIDGTQLLYASGQYGNGFTIFAGPPGSKILHQVSRSPGTGWGWFVTDDGDIWNADAPGKRIALYALKSIRYGQPVYDWKHPRSWLWPADFQTITRVIYAKATDSLYVFGYLRDQHYDGAWGTLGLTGRRYDGWLAGKTALRWTNAGLPISPGAFYGKTLPAKDVSLAGDYLFLGMVRDSKQLFLPKVSILDAASGKYVGTLVAGPEVGGLGSSEDMVGSVHATKRANGEYLVLIEDDMRGKNIMFRWMP